MREDFLMERRAFFGMKGWKDKETYMEGYEMFDITSNPRLGRAGPRSKGGMCGELTRKA